MVAVKEGKVQVFFENLTGDKALKIDTKFVTLQQLPSERVPLLEHLRLKEQGGAIVLDAKRVSFDDLFRHFMTQCPAGFADEKLLAQELRFKREARTAFLEHFGDGRGGSLVDARDADGIARGFGAVLNAQQILLSPQYERAPFWEAICIAENAVTFARGLMEYLAEDPTAKSFDRYVKALESVRPIGKQRVKTWPILTLFPFLARPGKDMFLKPDVTKKAADIIGVDIAYDSALTWDTYERVIGLGKIVNEALEKRGLHPGDFIETQSFIWVAVEYP